jgi:hypothetical protein
MSGRTLAAQGFPLTLSPSKGERKAFLNGRLGFWPRLVPQRQRAIAEQVIDAPHEVRDTAVALQRSP